MIEITHSRRDGTLVNEATRHNTIDRILGGSGGMGFRYSTELEAWYLRHTRDQVAKKDVIEETARRLREAGFEVTVTIDNVTPGRSIQEREAERAGRSQDREERFSGYASNAQGRSDGYARRADEKSDVIPLGQPVMSRADAKRRAKIRDTYQRSAEERNKAQYWQRRAESVGGTQERHEDVGVTLRRIETLEKELRDAAKELEASSGDRRKEWATTTQALTEELEYWRQHVKDKAEQEGRTLWGPEHFQKGDYVLQHGTWFQVVRVNKKSLTVPWMIHGINLGAWSTDHAKKRSARDGEFFTDTIRYDKVTRRATVEEVRARFPDRFADQ